MKQDCPAFFLDKTKSPKTGKALPKYSKEYNKIAKECFSENERELCKEWREHPIINPVSSKQIQKGKKVYFDLQKKCLQYPPAKPPPSRPISGKKLPSKKTKSPPIPPPKPKKISSPKNTPKSPKSLSRSPPKSPKSLPRSPPKGPKSLPRSPSKSPKSLSRELKDIGPFEDVLPEYLQFEIKHMPFVPNMDKNDRKKQYQWALKKAISQEDKKALADLVKFGRRDDINIALEHAVEQNKHSLVDFLIKQGGDIHHLNQRRQTLLHRAVQDYADPKMVKKLIDMGLDVNARDIEGKTPLLKIATNILGREEATNNAKLLLDNGADINAVDRNGISALIGDMLIRRRQISSLANLLIERGVDVNIRSTGEIDATALDLSLGNIDSVRLLIDNGASLDSQDREGNTALHMAVNQDTINKESVKIVELLLKKGANPNIKNKDGETPIFVIGKNKPKFVKLLVEYGADVDTPNKKGVTFRKKASAPLKKIIKENEFSVHIKEPEE